MKFKTLIVLICLIFFLPLFLSFSKPFTPAKLLQRAQKYKQDGRYLEALSLYRDIFMNTWAKQVSARLYKGIGDLYYEYLDDGKKALEFYNMLIEEFPHGPFAASTHHRVARIFFKQGKREKALYHYKYIFSSFPDYYKQEHIAKELEMLKGGESLLEDILLCVNRSLPQRVRILLKECSGPFEIFSTEGMEVYEPQNSASLRIWPLERIYLRAEGEKINIGSLGQLQSPLRITSLSHNCITVNRRNYRGFLWVYLKGKKLLVVNHVGLEEYLYGVVPREVPSTWPLASLMAQAVAARTYALYHMAKRENQLYDLYSSTASQVYGGKGSETISCRLAVDATKGLILSYDNKIALTLYHANSGGETERPEELWGKNFPYLVEKQDLFSINMPGFKWKSTLPADKIQSSLIDFGFPAENIMNIVPVDRDASGRVRRLEIVQPDISFYLSGNSFRLIVGPAKVKSTNFAVTKKKQKFIFQGNGYGHGVGMSQWGAYQMALKGYDYTEILQFYYPGAKIVKVQS